jgi:hypothetical protein
VYFFVGLGKTKVGKKKNGQQESYFQVAAEIKKAAQKNEQPYNLFHQKSFDAEGT